MRSLYESINPWFYLELIFSFLSLFEFYAMVRSSIVCVYVPRTRQ